MTEIYYTLTRRVGEDNARDVLADLYARGVMFVPGYLSIGATAGRIKAHHAMSLGDAYVCATAMTYGAFTVTGDPEILVAGAPWLPIDLRLAPVPPAHL